ncbi:peptidylprolyl isomerase [Salinibacterium sp. NG253]|uniref:peptidylprolyl isomerase n=1 Tax=Salinibacterium sp. NG253 TaxID=2792039 RepID=UPI0018CF8008|nr:peptidylprolyl isomerase [Salinibacterium sp. NG253]MBH0115554.1 peptidylprolyl isomerase [Salinibacterium sp. NG253]
MVASSKKHSREQREARERLRLYTARGSVHEQTVARRKRDNVLAVGVGLVIIALVATAQVFYFSAGPGTPEPAPSFTEEPEATESGNVGDVPDPALAEARMWTGELTLNDAVLGIELDGAAAPQAVASLVDSAASDYYVGTTCHRMVVTDSAGLIQCGSLDGTGAGDPDYAYGPVENSGVGGFYPAGTIAMARTGDDAFSNGRQFFIVFDDAIIPDDTAGGYSIVGQVTSGLDALQSEIVAGGIVDDAQDGAPVTATSITGFTIQ